MLHHIYPQKLEQIFSQIISEENFKTYLANLKKFSTNSYIETLNILFISIEIGVNKNFSDRDLLSLSRSIIMRNLFSSTNKIENIKVTSDYKINTILNPYHIFYYQEQCILNAWIEMKSYDTIKPEYINEDKFKILGSYIIAGELIYSLIKTKEKISQELVLRKIRDKFKNTSIEKDILELYAKKY